MRLWFGALGTSRCKLVTNFATFPHVLFVNNNTSGLFTCIIDGNQGQMHQIEEYITLRWFRVLRGTSINTCKVARFAQVKFI